MSNELVPLTYQRYAYNAHHGTELPHHDSRLTAEQTAQINDNYDIEVYLGIHGTGKEPGAETIDNITVLPTQKEYDAAAAVVNSLRPGDTLFVEAYGFKEPAVEPVPPVPKPEELAPAFGSASSARFFSSHFEMLAHEMRRNARNVLEDSRQNYRISAWDYARQLAQLKGIWVVKADLDAFDKEHITALNGGKDSFQQLLIDPEAENQELREDTHARRELQVPSIVKDWALDHLPEAEAQNAQGRKPKLAVLFGSGHAEPLEQAFANLHLRARTIAMDESSIKERRQEQAQRIIGQIFKGLVEYAVEASQSPPPVENAKPESADNSLASQRPRNPLAGLGRMNAHRFGVVNPDRYRVRLRDPRIKP